MSRNYPKLEERLNEYYPIKKTKRLYNLIVTFLEKRWWPNERKIFYSGTDFKSECHDSNYSKGGTYFVGIIGDSKIDRHTSNYIKDLYCIDAFGEVSDTDLYKEIPNDFLIFQTKKLLVSKDDFNWKESYKDEIDISFEQMNRFIKSIRIGKQACIKSLGKSEYTRLAEMVGY